MNFESKIGICSTNLDISDLSVLPFTSIISFCNLQVTFGTTLPLGYESSNLLIADLKPLISNINDAAMLVPAIKDFMEVGVKNDEHLVKLAAVIQRAMVNKGEETSSFLTDEEKDALLKGIQDIQEEQEENKIGTRSTKDDNSWTEL